MTTIRYNTDSGYITLRVNGHADYAPKGQDIVCASVSALVQTLGLYVQEHSGEAAKGEDYYNIFARDNRFTREVADAVMSGLRQIAAQYPDNVRIL
jgi:uncharacterized protein YsxB (DUF464 family)